MAIATTIINKTKDASGRVIARNITFANPEASDENLVSFVEAFNSLSKNTPISVERVDKHTLSTGGGTTPAPTMQSPNLTVKDHQGTTIGDSVEYTHTGSSGVYFTVERAGDGAISASSDNTEYIDVSFDSSNNHLKPGTTKRGAEQSRVSANITVTVAESEEYTSDSKVFTITFKAGGEDPITPIESPDFPGVV